MLVLTFHCIKSFPSWHRAIPGTLQGNFMSIVKIFFYANNFYFVTVVLERVFINSVGINCITDMAKVLELLVQTVLFPQGYGPESTQLHDFILPVIDASTDTKQDQHVYLLEDGLELWHITLLNAPHSSPSLLKLFKNMPQLFGKYSSDS